MAIGDVWDSGEAHETLVSMKNIAINQSWANEDGGGLYSMGAYFEVHDSTFLGCGASYAWVGYGPLGQHNETPPTASPCPSPHIHCYTTNYSYAINYTLTQLRME